MKAISYSQTLGSKVRAMREGKEKEAWEKECVDVSALLAYSDLSICPVRGYLAQERREGLAEMVNAAILCESSSASPPRAGLMMVGRLDWTCGDACAGARSEADDGAVE
jgi:hypothetical protein